MVERTGFVIYFRHPKVLKEVEKLVNITYLSKKNNYCVAYCDTKRFAGLKQTLMQTKGVRGVEQSQLDMDQYIFDETEIVPFEQVVHDDLDEIMNIGKKTDSVK